jgi:hypothetical protein
MIRELLYHSPLTTHHSPLTTEDRSMASADTRTESPGFIPWLAANRGAAGLGLMALGVALAVLPVWLGSKYRTDYVAVTALTGLLALLVLGMGVVIRSTPAAAGGVEGQELMRIYTLILGGVAGLLVALTGAALSYYWWDDLTRWLRLGERDGAWRVLAALTVLLGGLALMFVSLQAVRSSERSSPVLRRLVYGYNAVLTGLLLLMILAVVNVLVTLKVTGVIDATQSRQFSVSDRTTNLLKNLDRPVRVYVIWPVDDDITLQTLRNLLTTFEDTAPDLKVTYLSPTYNVERVTELRRQYPGKLEEQVGVLVVQGEEKPENATFLKFNDLFAEEGFGPAAQFKFRGEDKIAAALSAPGGGRGKTVVYVTQGAGEPDLNDTGQRQADRGLGVLRDRLNARGNFDVRPLAINPGDPKVPDDAGVVVVANPRPPVEPPVEQALRSYLVDRKGKAVVLFDTPPPGYAKDAMPATGLERLLGEFNVEVTAEQVRSILLSAGGLAAMDGGLFEVNAELAQENNELAQAFAAESFLLPSVRVVRAGQGGGNFTAQSKVLLQSRPRARVWVEKDLRTDLQQQAQMILRNPAEAKRLVSESPVPAAVIVTETAPPPPVPGGPPPEAKPRLAVFGDTTWVTNEYASERSGQANFSFFASVLDWLVERPSSIGVESKALPVYAMDPKAADNVARLYFLPLVLALVGIVGLGLGVWVVRRR